MIDELLVERDELLRENQSLKQENQEMAELLKDYERGMESTTEIIREHAVGLPLFYMATSCSRHLVSSVDSNYADSSRLQSEAEQRENGKRASSASCRRGRRSANQSQWFTATSSFRRPPG